MGGGGAHVAPAIAQQCWVPFYTTNTPLLLTTPEARMSASLRSSCSTEKGAESSGCRWYTQMSCSAPCYKRSPDVGCQSIYSSMLNGRFPASFVLHRGEMEEGQAHCIMKQEEPRLACASFVNGGDGRWSGAKTKRTRRGRRGGKNRRRHQAVVSDEEYQIQPESEPGSVIKPSHEKTEEKGLISAKSPVWGCHFSASSKTTTSSHLLRDVADDTGSGSCTSLASFTSSKCSSVHEGCHAVSQTISEWLEPSNMPSSYCASGLAEKNETGDGVVTPYTVMPHTLSNRLLDGPMCPQNGDDGFNSQGLKNDLFAAVSKVGRTRFGSAEWQQSLINRAPEQSRHVEGHQRRATAHLPDQKKRSSIVMQFADAPQAFSGEWLQEVVFAPLSLASSLFSDNNETDELPRFFEKDNDWLPPRSCLA